jgi:hypothetical protein
LNRRANVGRKAVAEFERNQDLIRADERNHAECGLSMNGLRNSEQG